MSIEQLELILSDTYQMDVSFPMIFGHRKEFMQSSYSIWSVNELLEYVSSELYLFLIMKEKITDELQLLKNMIQ